MWLVRCWGRAVSSIAELEVGGRDSQKFRGERERDNERGARPDRTWEQNQQPGISLSFYLLS